MEKKKKKIICLEKFFGNGPTLYVPFVRPGTAEIAVNWGMLSKQEGAYAFIENVQEIVPMYIRTEKMAREPFVKNG